MEDCIQDYKMPGLLAMQQCAINRQFLMQRICSRPSISVEPRCLYSPLIHPDITKFYIYHVII